VALLGLIVWLVPGLTKKPKAVAKHPAIKDYDVATAKEVDRIFDDAFRQELRNRGLLHFEKIINENAMFLKQDLLITASQVNDYMKQEIKRTLTEEFAKYETSISDAKQLAVDSINKTQRAIEEQRTILTDQMNKQVEIGKEQIMARFESNMADIINHYVMIAIGDQIDLNDQLEYIIADLEANKTAIIEDINHGA
jgi:hypothetical protein